MREHNATAREYELELQDFELKFLLRSVYRLYSRYVFAILRAEELDGYYPATAARDMAYGKLCQTLACPDFADQVLEYYRACEAEGRI